jgi:hypothetical protein
MTDRYLPQFRQIAGARVILAAQTLNQRKTLRG